MFKTELNDSVKQVRNPLLRIILYGGFIIIGSLSTGLFYQYKASGDVQRKIYDNVVSENKAKDSIIDALNNKIADLNARQYQFILNELETERQKREVNKIIDSLNQTYK